MKTLFLSFSLALRNLGRQGRRTASTLAAIAVGLVGLAFLDGYITYSMWGLKETIIHSGTGHIQVATSAAYFDEGDSDPFPYLLSNSKALAKALRKLPEVKDVVPSLNFAAVGQAGAKTENLRVQAYPTAQRVENLSFLTLVSGAELDPEAGGSILVGAGLATKLGLTPGSSLTLFALGSGGGITNQNYTVAGIVTTRIADFDNVLVIADLADAQALLGTDMVPQLTVFLEHTEDTATVLAHLKAQPPASAAPGTVFEGWEQLSPYFRQANGSYQLVLAVARFIVLIVALFSIAGTLNLSVLERLRELGTLRAFGTRRSQVIQLLIVEGFLLGLAGALVGTLAGWGLTEALNAAGGLAMPAQPGMSTALTILFRGDPAHALSNALWVLVAAVVGAWFPGHFATRRLPADLLRSPQ